MGARRAYHQRTVTTGERGAEGLRSDRRYEAWPCGHDPIGPQDIHSENGVGVEQRRIRRIDF